MQKVVLLGKIIMLIGICGILLLIVKYAGTIRNFTYHYLGSQKSVAGAQTSLEKEVKDNVQEYTDSIKDQVMSVRVSDVIQGISKVNKIGKDIEAGKEYLLKQINNTKKK